MTETTFPASWSEALLAPGTGFYRRPGRGARHDFSTSATRSPLLARALAPLVADLAAAAGAEKRDLPVSSPLFSRRSWRELRPTGGSVAVVDVVDVGAGDGSLLRELRAALPAGVRERVRWVGVDVRDRPPGLDPAIAWTDTVPREIRGLLVAHEYLDTLPVTPVALPPHSDQHVDHCGSGGRQTTPTSTTARESHDHCGTCSGFSAPAGPRPLSHAELGWLAEWWPGGGYAEVGLARDAAWRDLTGRLAEGMAVAIDYGHTRATRPAHSTVTGWRRGRRVDPLTDGDRDVTAHVAMDSLAEPGDELLTQREALTRLGVSAAPPAPTLAAQGPAAYLRALAETQEAAALLDPAGLGGYLWLVHRC